MTSAPTSEADNAPWYTGLSSRLFALTLVSILLIELIVFIPSASDFRVTWLSDRGEAARIAALALEAAPSRMVSDELGHTLLDSAEVLSVSESEDDMKTLLLTPVEPIEGTFHLVDLTKDSGMTHLMNMLGLFIPSGEHYIIVTDEGTRPDRQIEFVVPETPLKNALKAYAWRIGGLSMLIGLISSTLLYFALHYYVVSPIKRVTKSVQQIGEDPGSWTQRLLPTSRRDELGRSQNALAKMETAVAESFRQRTHLAELGSAVAKISHDLRNSLASAQIVSESLALSDDPRVAKAAPRLEKSLERAIRLANDTLEYGKAAPQPPSFIQLSLALAAKEATEEALAPFPDTSYTIDIPTDLYVSADREHLHRLLVNLIRNAAQAMTQTPHQASIVKLSARTNTLRISDSGPGIPPRIKDSLFTPFRSSANTGGSGLGLVIAKELAEGMGWTLQLESSDTSGTVFRVCFPQTPSV